MNHGYLVDGSEKLDTAGLENVMKSFNYSLYLNAPEVKDVFDVQAIMTGGKADDFLKCIQSILNYSFNTCTNNSNVKVLDSSFIRFFHVAQFIIRFLLHWKSELSKENMKLKNQIQELEKLRKDCYSRKLEIKDLKRQLSKYQRYDDESKPTGVSECPQCKKMFVNSTFLYAHHRRRHPDQPFTDIEKENEIKILKDQVHELNQRLKILNHDDCEKTYMSSEAEDACRTSVVPLKMKIFPELSCLEAQEKFWRGRLKDLYDNFEKEKQSMKNFLNKLNAENSRLKEELANIQYKSQSVSIGIQTNISIDPKNDEAIQFNQKPRLSTHYEKLREYLSENLSSEFNPDSEQSTRIPEVRRRTCLPTAMNRIVNQLQENDKIPAEYLKNNLLPNVTSIVTPANSCEVLLHPCNVDIIPTISDSSFVTSQISDSLRNLRSRFPISSTGRLSPDSNQVEEALSEDSAHRKEPDIIEQVNLFLANYKHRKRKGNDEENREDTPAGVDSHEDEKKVIMKFFTTEQLADKLIKIYDKRRSLLSSTEELDELPNSSENRVDRIADIPESPPMNDSSLEIVGNVQQNEIKICDDERDPNKNDSRSEGRVYSNDCQNDASTSISNNNTEDEFTTATSTPLPTVKDKTKFLPFFRNIPSKIFKNYSKSRRICADIIDDKILRKLPSRSRSEVEKAKTQQDLLQFETLPDEYKSPSTSSTSDNTSYPSAHIPIKNQGRELVSALKISKSTGNITKKVSFADDFSSLKTVSEADLCQIPAESGFQNHPCATVGTVHVHCDKITKPVPAPRTKKNVIISTNHTNHH